MDEANDLLHTFPRCYQHGHLAWFEWIWHMCWQYLPHSLRIQILESLLETMSKQRKTYWWRIATARVGSGPCSHKVAQSDPANLRVVNRNWFSSYKWKNASDIIGLHPDGFVPKCNDHLKLWPCVALCGLVCRQSPNECGVNVARWMDLETIWTIHNYPLFACQDAVRSAQIELLRLSHFWPPRWRGWYHWDVTAAWYVVLVSELGECIKSQLWLCLIWAWYEQSGQLIRNPIGETCGPHWTGQKDPKGSNMSSSGWAEHLYTPSFLRRFSSEGQP